jgi:hypothetical protein
MDLREIGWGVWSGFVRLRIGTVGGLLWMRWWTFGFCRHGASYKNWISSETKSDANHNKGEWRLETVLRSLKEGPV